MRASLRLLVALAGALALHAFAQPTPDAEGALPDMPAARAPSSAELGVQTVEIPRASVKDAEDAPQTLTGMLFLRAGLRLKRIIRTGTPLSILEALAT